MKVIYTESEGISAGSGGINPMQALSSALSLLGNSHESERSLTKSAISENIQIDTKTPEKLTALSRDTKQANQQVNQQDLGKVQERQEMAQVIGEISNNAISIATYNEREKINRLELEKFQAAEKLGDKRHTDEGKQILAGYDALINQIQENIDRSYGVGSPNGMAIRAVTAALQAAAQNDTNGAIVALASPYLNNKIHEMTKGDTAKDKATNLIAHALLSAIEFQVTGKDPLTGAVAGVTGEVTAEIIAQKLYEKSPKELTVSEKENISTLSQLAGGLAGALTGKANGTSKENGGGMALAVAGAETAKRAVENNTFFIGATDPEYVKSLQVKAKADEIIKSVEKEVDQEISDRFIPHYVSGVLSYGPLGFKYTVNSRTGESFLSVNYSNEFNIGKIGWGGTIETGWILNLEKNEMGKNLPATITNALEGYSFGGQGCFYACLGYTETISPKPKKILSIGTGKGFSIGSEYTEKLK